MGISELFQLLRLLGLHLDPADKVGHIINSHHVVVFLHQLELDRNSLVHCIFLKERGNQIKAIKDEQRIGGGR